MPGKSDYGPENCLAVIYAGSHLPIDRIPPERESMLGMLSKILGHVLAKWDKE
jgi:hypothetical protein